jgi:Zn-dependent peptidase ImmA (M78 family)
MAKPEEVARRILSEHDLVRAPVPVERLAKKLGARLSYQPFSENDDDVSGLLYRDGSRTIIGINSTHAPTRQRFTIAHELGHLLLHPGKPMILDRARVNLRNSVSSMASDTQEIEANQFAAALLMPRDFLLSELKQMPAKRADTLIEGLAKKFNVSREAMRHRLVNLGILPSSSGF